MDLGFWIEFQLSHIAVEAWTSYLTSDFNFFIFNGDHGETTFKGVVGDEQNEQCNIWPPNLAAEVLLKYCYYLSLF